MRTAIIIFMLIVFSSQTYSQTLDRYRIISDEKHYYMGSKTDKAFRDQYNEVIYTQGEQKFKDVEHVVVGDFNNDGNDEFAMIGKTNELNIPFFGDYEFQINVCESKAYRVLGPTTHYDDYDIVHDQEGYSMPLNYYQYTDSTGTHNDTLDPRMDENPIISRYKQSSAWHLGPVFAVAGDFDGDADGRDEIMIFNQYLDGNSTYTEVSMFKNNDTNSVEIWKYEFDKTVIYDDDAYDYFLEDVKFVVVCDHDGDGVDEVFLLHREDTTNTLIRFYYDQSDWDFDTDYTTYSNTDLDVSKVIGITAGDININSKDEIIIVYDKDTTAQEIFYLDPDSTYARSTSNLYSESDTILDFSKIEHVIGGDFNGDGNIQLSLVVDQGSGTEMSGDERVQEIYISKDTGLGWEVVKEYGTSRNNMSFDKDVMAFAFACNIDYDIEGRDDIVSIYYEQDDSLHVMPDYPTRQELNSIIAWRSLPEFADNDYLMDMTVEDSLLPDQKEPWLPIGPMGMRLISAFDLDLREYNDSLENWYMRKGTYTYEYYEEISNIFNCVLPNRKTFTDYDIEWGHTRTIIEPGRDGVDSAHIYDYWTNYQAGLKAYLDKAQEEGLNVIPIISAIYRDSYDTLTYPDTNKAEYYMDFNDYSDHTKWPSYHTNIFNDLSIIEHPALEGIWLDDEPTGKIPERDWYLDYDDHFERTLPDSLVSKATYPYPGPNAIDYDHIKQVDTNYYREIKEVLASHSVDKPLLVNYLAASSNLRFFNNISDAIGIDVYPYTNVPSWKDSMYITQEGFAGSIDSYSDKIFSAVIRDNHEFGWHFLQTYDRYHDKLTTYYNIDNNGDTLGILDIPTKATPSHNYLRYSLFSSTIHGLRGQFLFIYPKAERNDTLHLRNYVAFKEFNYYYDWFLTESMKNFVTTDHQRDTYSQHSGDFNTPNHNDIEVDMYYNNDIYLVLVSNAENKEYDTKNVEITANIENLSSNEVYLLSPDYWANGAYETISSTYDGNFIEFNDEVGGRQIMIYAVGGLPTWNKPTQWIEGEFGNSNQQQLVAYPVLKNDQTDLGSIDSLVYYHTVYQRTDDITGETDIYYRRSLPTDIFMPKNLIEWETERWLSDKISIRNTIGPDRDVSEDFCLECTEKVSIHDAIHPSLVVRWDSTAMVAKVYVAFNVQVKASDMLNLTCDFDKPEHFMIGECIFIAGEPDEEYVEYDPVQIATYRGGFTEHGNPTINSSHMGNYYVWSDKEDGVVVAYKQDDEDCFNSVLDSTSFKWYSNTTTQVAHPSVNPYSRVMENHEDIAVVWQEKSDTLNLDDEYDIYYTRVSRFNFDDDTDSQLSHYLTLPQCHSFSHGVTLDTSKQMALLSTLWHSYDNQYPVVYRGVELVDETWMRQMQRNDRIFWQSKDDSSRATLNFAYVDYIDTFDINQGGWYPNCRIYGGPWHIRGENMNLAYPVVSQGMMQVANGNNVLSTDSIYVLNFVEYDTSPDDNSNLWQINDDYWGMLNSWELIGNENEFDFTDFISDTLSERSFDKYRKKYAKQIIGEGSKPQLAVMPYIIGRNAWQLNRRLFEHDNGTDDEIKISMEHFAKQSIMNTDRNQTKLYGYASNSKNANKMTFITLANELNNNEFLNYIVSQNGDTIYTEYFDHESISQFQFFLNNDFDNNDVKISIIRESDEKTKNVPINKNTVKQFTKAKYNLIGIEDRYKFVIVNKDPNAWYYNELLLNGLPSPIDTTDEVRYKTNYIVSPTINIDFDDMELSPDEFLLHVYPNPTNNGIVNVLTSLPVKYNCIDKISYEVVSADGIIINVFDTNDISVFQVDVSNISNSVVYIKGTAYGNCLSAPITYVAKVVVNK